MQRAALVIQLLSFAFLFIGFWRYSRGLMLAAALGLWTGGSLPDAVRGARDGWNAGR